MMDKIETTPDLERPQESQSALAKILCGNTMTDKTDHNDILNHLSNSIDQIIDQITDLNDNNISFYGPFLGRSILEVGATALISRLDPLRVLILQEKQKQPNFEVGKPNKSSIQWRGDVLSASRTSDLWVDKALQNPTRALLGEYYTELVWLKNVNILFDHLSDIEGNEWIDNDRIVPIRIDLDVKSNHQLLTKQKKNFKLL